ncbi:hypothetical protein [Streptomyces sp. NBC_00239]|uniref:hypothetical protein n=1 Tax=Streptomyces sp. NBC_00239 TaxID=2903640 RepID=UPI002E2DE939|nr:hypothetical protein [Streptomyces sp. NBC_00239]
MNTAVKITVFTAALAASFGAAYGVGGAVGPVSVGSQPAAHAGHAAGTASAGAGLGSGRADSPAGGLQVSEAGYTLDLKTPRLDAGQQGELRFAIRDEAGRQVTAYQREHDKELHLILASRDQATYRHLHPAKADDGTWSTPVNLPAAGDYRVFADFTPAGKDAKNLILGADLAASGPYKPAEPPTSSRTATVDGYTVNLDGDLRPGAAAELKLNVTKGGRAVTDLQPYLGAYGHLVALRSGDLAYLHVHPNGEPGDGTTKPGPEISFTTTAPTTGTYRLFLDFQHNGTVRTAAFTVQARAAGADGGQQEPAGRSTDGHRH